MVFKSSAPPQSQLLHFSIAESIHLLILTLQRHQNSFLLRLHAGKYFHHYENLKLLDFATNTTHRVGEKDRRVKAVFLTNYHLPPEKPNSSHFHRCKEEWNFSHSNTHLKIQCIKAQPNKRNPLTFNQIK